MSDLTDFLLARIAEDEAVARSAQHGPESKWSWASVDFNSDVAEAHGRRHDPAHVLRECEAKQRIVAMHHHDGSGGCGADDEWYPCPTIRELAAVYTDHLDYREEWKP